MNNKDIIFIVLTYQRPKVLGMCIDSLFNNTKIKPSETWILDDASDKDIQKSILEFSQHNSQNTPIHTIFNGKNLGVGCQFERIFNLIKQRDPEIVCIIESDYIFRNEWLEDVCAVFDAAPYTVGIPGVDHADMYIRQKTHGEFIDLMVAQFGEDLKSREDLYKPFSLNTERGPIKVFGASNTCGCQILHWKRIKDLFFKNLNIEKDYWHWMERGFHKWGGERRFASDAHMSGTHSYYWDKWAQKNGIDTSKNFGYLNICDSAISVHLASQGINGKLDPRVFPEGTTFQGVNGDNFPTDYKTWTRNAK